MPTIFELCAKDRYVFSKTTLTIKNNYCVLSYQNYIDSSWQEEYALEISLLQSPNDRFSNNFNKLEYIQPSLKETSKVLPHLHIFKQIIFYNSIDNTYDAIDNKGVPLFIAKQVKKERELDSIAFFGYKKIIARKIERFTRYVKNLIDDVVSIEFDEQISNRRYGRDSNTMDYVWYATPNKIIYKTYSIPIEEESAGTKRILKIVHSLVLGDFAESGIVVIDEIDAGLHDTLAVNIMNIFNNHNDYTNSKKAKQLIFTTHNTNLLTEAPLRRDQIWFIEMDESRTTKLYSLVEVEPKQTADFRRKYLSGKYGALPNVTCCTKDLNYAE